MIPKTRLVLVDVWAPQCGPCKVMTPILESLHKEMDGKFKLVMINADEQDKPEVRNFLKENQIMAIPTVMIYKDGGLVRTIRGLMPKDTIKSALETA